MAGRGGARPGAGRPKGSKDKTTREVGATLSELARAHTSSALATLIELMNDRLQPGAVRVSAANSLLDRGYGRAPQAVQLTGADGVSLAEEAASAAERLQARFNLLAERAKG